MSKQKPFNLTKSNLPALTAKLQDLMDFQSDKQWQVVIQERNSDRSLEQNARLWDLYTSIGNHLGYTPDEMHDLMGYKFLLVVKYVGLDKITKIRSTTDLSVKEMGEYQMKIESWASNLGWSWDD
jgi:hypothetical protein